MRSTLSLKLIAISLVLYNSTYSQSDSHTTIGGYGELHYNEPDGIKKGMLDFHRFVIYLGHNFNDKISFRSEIEIEHTRIVAGNASGGELAIEQAYLDYYFNSNIGMRAGILLPPVGLINLYHEPPTFHGVERPNVERNIIPTTWRESGAGIYGDVLEGLKYQLYVMAGFKAEGFSSSSGLRGGRQHAFESNPTNPSFSGRVDYSPILGLQLGASFFFGGSTAGVDSIGNAMVSMWSADARFDIDNFAFRAVGVTATIGDAEKINAKFQKGVADRIYGYYIEGAYNFLPVLCEDSEQQLFAFVRYEKYNTQARTTGFAPMTQFNRNDVLVGLTYKPTYNTVFKFDYAFLNNALNSGPTKNTKQMNIGLGYFFN